MTNRNMVKDVRDGGGKAPEPNRAPPTPVPAPEDDPNIWTTDDPMDSPQPQPMVRQDKTKGLQKR
jgi:hypothetical protein